MIENERLLELQSWGEELVSNCTKCKGQIHKLTRPPNCINGPRLKEKEETQGMDENFTIESYRQAHTYTHTHTHVCHVYISVAVGKYERERCTPWEPRINL